MMTKLENIANDVKDIKRDYKETRAEVQDLHDRVLIVENEPDDINADNNEEVQG